MQRTTKFGFLRYSHDFFETYKILNNAQPRFTSLLECKYFLLGRTLELVLKALLMQVGFNVSYIKKLGHDLQVLSALANIRYFELNLSITEIANINLLNEYYLSKEFEYPSVGSKSLPKLDVIEAILDKILVIADKEVKR